MVKEIRSLKDGFEEMVIKVWPILEKASQRGIPIDTKERDELIVYLNNERGRIYAEIQNKVPDEIRNIHPLNGYVRVPERVQELISSYNTRVTTIRVPEGKKIISIDDYVSKSSYSPIIKAGEETKIWGRFRQAKFTVLDKKSLEEFEVVRWCRVEDFNPNASKQIIKYMKSKGHKVPVKLDGNETSEAKELERLAITTKDAFYDGIIEYRQINKMLTNDLPNWMPDEKTRAVHTEFGFYPATGQINSRNPNVQNANKHKPLGKRFRRIIRARDYRHRSFESRGEYGRRRILVECDYSGFHALMLGREARSARYIFLAQNDIHSWLTSHIIGDPLVIPVLSHTKEVEEFKNKLKRIKKEQKVIRDTQAKPTILGVGLGLGPRKMYWMNREKFDKKLNMMVGIKSEGQSKQLQGLIKVLLPEIFDYQDMMKEIAFRQTYLINKWGMIRWFFDVRGEDGEAAIAFNVQGNAHGMLRWVMRRLDEEYIYKRYLNDNLGLSWVRLDGEEIRVWNEEGCPEIKDGVLYNSALERFYFINTIHDSLVFEPWEEEISICIQIVQEAMETPCLVLRDEKVCPDGLVVRVESSYGENWAEYDEKINQGGMKLWMGK